MLADPALERWVRTGDPGGRAFPAGADPSARLAAYHALVHRRTTALIGPGGRWQAPWPRALGTPPWGAARELETIAGLPVGGYRTVLVRPAPGARLARLIDQLSRHLRPDRPAALFVGSAAAPRHVALLAAAPSGLVVYDPGDGQVSPLDVPRLAARRLPVGGWQHPWLIVGPVG